MQAKTENPGRELRNYTEILKLRNAIIETSNLMDKFNHSEDSVEEKFIVLGNRSKNIHSEAKRDKKVENKTQGNVPKKQVICRVPEERKQWDRSNI